MGIQALVVFIGLGFALAVGVVAGTWYASSPLAGWLAISSVPVMWGLMYFIERVTGREIWHYTAPYPYPSMQAGASRDETAVRNVPELDGVDVAPHKYPQAA
jgi:hypothetical protein